MRRAFGDGLFAYFMSGSSVALAEAWPAKTVDSDSPVCRRQRCGRHGSRRVEQVSKQVGRPIVVENRVGAGGTLGANRRQSRAGRVHGPGNSSSLAAAHGLYPKLPYDTLGDFAPIIPLGLQPMVLVTAPSKGYKTLGDLIAAAKAKPGTFNFASAGVGSASHIAAERLRIGSGFKAQHIPFKGAMEALPEIWQGEWILSFFPLAPALPLIKSGKLVALAVSTSKRTMAMPDVPTMTEAGLADRGMTSGSDCILPVKTSRDIVVKLHAKSKARCRRSRSASAWQNLALNRCR